MVEELEMSGYLREMKFQRNSEGKGDLALWVVISTEKPRVELLFQL